MPVGRPGQGGGSRAATEMSHKSPNFLSLILSLAPRAAAGPAASLCLSVGLGFSHPGCEWQCLNCSVLCPGVFGAGDWLLVSPLTRPLWVLARLRGFGWW